jgi:glycerophosphoryl diester phosphodiesterase
MFDHASSFRALLENAGRPLVGAHRGASADYPENTSAAFAAAAAQGADFWEIDVRLSADGVPVVFTTQLSTAPLAGAGRWQG